MFFSLVEATGGRPAPPPEIFAKLSRGEARIPTAVAAAYQGDAPGFAYFSFRDAKIASSCNRRMSPRMP